MGRASGHLTQPGKVCFREPVTLELSLKALNKTIRWGHFSQRINLIKNAEESCVTSAAPLPDLRCQAKRQKKSLEIFHLSQGLQGQFWLSNLLEYHLARMTAVGHLG